MVQPSFRFYKPKAALLFLSTLLAQVNFSEGPLLQSGQYYAKMAAQAYSTEEVFDGDGVISKSYNRFTGYRYTLEGDAGINSFNTVGIVAGFTTVKESLDGKTEGFSDLELTLKHAFIRKINFLFCMEGKLYIPLQDDYRPAVRFGSFGAGLMLFLAVRETLFDYPCMASFGAGFDSFRDTAEDIVKVRLRAAACPLIGFSLRGTLKLDYGLQNGSYQPSRSLVDYNTNYRLLRGDFELICEPRPCLQVAVGFFDNFWGRHVGSGGGIQGWLASSF